MVFRRLTNSQSCLLAAVVMTLALLVVYQTSVPSAVLLVPAAPALHGHASRPRQPSSVRQMWHQCRKVLFMSENQYFWEADAGRRRCRATQRSADEILEALQKLQQSRPGGQSAKLVFIGDSRVRNLQQTVMERLHLRPDSPSAIPILYSDVYDSVSELRKAFPPQLRPAGLQGGCVEAHAMRINPKMVRCSLGAETDTFRSESWWRVYLRDIFREKLDSLLSECREGRCPDLVVIDNGPWYANVSRYPGERATARAAEFIADLNDLRHRIARLAASTRLLWKLDEQYMPEVAFGHKTDVTRAMMVLSAVVFEAAARIPDLTLWTSGMVETTWFYHQICLPHRNELKNFNNAPVRYECIDPMHVGETVRWKMLQSLFNVLLFSASSPSRTFCCGT